MTSAIDRATRKQAADASAWYLEHQTDIAIAASAAGCRAGAITGHVYEIAIHHARRGRLAKLTASRAVRLALRREADNYLVARLRGEPRPYVMDGLDDFDLMIPADGTPLDVLLALEDERESEDHAGDHDDRLSLVAARAAAGYQPIELPRVTRESDARTVRRYRCRARDLRAAGQGDFWGWGEAA